MRGGDPTAGDTSPVLICDLDGTILFSNSFPLWIIFLMFGWLPEPGLPARMMLSLRVQKLLLDRRLGRIDHGRLMRGVQHAWHRASDGAAASAADRVTTRLRRLVRPSVEPVLHQIASGEIDAVLATAAAAEYARPLGVQLGFCHVLATPCRLPAAGVLNRGAEKLRRVQEFLADRQWAERPRVLLTDHLDDLPLLQHCDAVGWFGSSEMMARALTETKGVRFVDCHRLDAAALTHAVAELSGHAAAPADSTLA